MKKFVKPFPADVVRHSLRTGFEAMPSLSGVDDDVIAQLQEYLSELYKWNQTYNLTAIRDPLAMVAGHVLDSASISPLVQGEDVLDVGSGGGTPGLVLALLARKRRVVLLDANGKKCRFLNHVKRHLQLDHVSVAHMRVESFVAEFGADRAEGGFDTIVCRAYSSLDQFVTTTDAALRPGGVWLAMKGQNPVDEMAAVPKNYHCDVQALTVPTLQQQRHAVTVQRVTQHHE